MNEYIGHLTTTNIGLNIGRHLRKSEVIATDFRPKKEQRESAYVSRKRMGGWVAKTLSEDMPGSRTFPWLEGHPGDPGV